MQKEIRAEIENPDSVAEKLIEEAKVQELDVVEQEDTYFGSIELYEKLDRSFLVRIREEDSRTIINYKSEVEEDIWDEHETVIDSPEETKKTFRGMGLEHVLDVKKKRRSFKKDGMRIHIDSIKNLGHFIEVKLDLEKNEKEDVMELLSKAGVEEDSIIDKGYVTKLLERQNSKYAEWCTA
ncbi:MAG: class IV adenylate cyclase [Candidatus Nanohaloarchaea archaeon]|nr:class IV adenylate cyclase [Candidatus Nanohaloarchaea archaeon]